MDLPQYLQGLSFRFVEPGQKRTLASGVAAALMGLRVPLDGLNTRLPFDRSDMRRKLRRTRLGAAGRPLAIRAILNRGVAHLSEREAFVAFGLGNGDALLAAIAGNREKLCIGVQECAPHELGDAFLRRFDELANGECHFIEASFRRCVARLENRPIGLCFVSANSHEPIAERLSDCEPHLAENAYLLIDNGNCARTRQTALEFVAASRNQYRVLMDARSAETCALTWGRGLFVIQLLGRNAVGRSVTGHGTSPVLVPAA
ncbi:MAG TPA: hypothetical protein VGP76_09265 [Planctomycetaceae bacterium]|jgi:hypothetical protein|nr:hypothetical protein [Planctomycetaceae bacterium]